MTNDINREEVYPGDSQLMAMCRYVGKFEEHQNAALEFERRHNDAIVAINIIDENYKIDLATVDSSTDSELQKEKRRNDLLVQKRSAIAEVKAKEESSKTSLIIIYSTLLSNYYDEKKSNLRTKVNLPTIISAIQSSGSAEEKELLQKYSNYRNEYARLLEILSTCDTQQAQESGLTSSLHELNLNIQTCESALFESNTVQKMSDELDLRYSEERRAIESLGSASTTQKESSVQPSVEITAMNVSAQPSLKEEKFKQTIDRLNLSDLNYKATITSNKALITKNGVNLVALETSNDKTTCKVHIEEGKEKEAAKASIAALIAADLDPSKTVLCLDATATEAFKEAFKADAEENNFKVNEISSQEATVENINLQEPATGCGFSV